VIHVSGQSSKIYDHDSDDNCYKRIADSHLPAWHNEVSETEKVVAKDLDRDLVEQFQQVRLASQGRFVVPYEHEVKAAHEIQ